MIKRRAAKDNVVYLKPIKVLCHVRIWKGRRPPVNDYIMIYCRTSDEILAEIGREVRYRMAKEAFESFHRFELVQYLSENQAATF